MKRYDVGVVGAGGAGMMCALQAGRRGRSVILLEHSPVIGRKIRISGGGRCNFTNTGAGPGNYISGNPDFCRSALARYTPADFMEMVRASGIRYHEKKLGQLFCDESAQQIIDMLVEECRQAGVKLLAGCRVTGVDRGERFAIRTGEDDFSVERLVIATGGLSVPKTGATDFGYRVAEQFGLRIVDTAPALDAFVFSEADRTRFDGLAGVSLPVRISCNGLLLEEQALFTHTGLSGPAALQASLYWRPGDSVAVNLLPEMTAEALLSWFGRKKGEGSRAELKTLLAERLPRRVAERFCEIYHAVGRPFAEQPVRVLATLHRGLQDWRFTPAGTAGYGTAEVTRGGVDTRELSSKTMESVKVPGLFFVGEVVDVTGWLGGYNFQWAWSSGWAAGQAV